MITFDQSPWLKSYIDFNTHHRTLSGSGFLKDFKLMNNSVFGKTQKNLWNRMIVNIETDADKLRKRVAKTSSCRAKVIAENLAVVQYNIKI